MAAYRASLEVRTREVTPRDWAITQHNLGVALRNIGVRTDGPTGDERLIEAASAFRSALEVRTREAMPDDWGRDPARPRPGPA